MVRTRHCEKRAAHAVESAARCADGVSRGVGTVHQADETKLEGGGAAEGGEA
jgi:hypothetical protein